MELEEFFFVSGRIFSEKDPNFSSIWFISEIEKARMNPCRALWSHYHSERKHVVASGPGQWRGWKSLLGFQTVLEEEGLEDGVVSGSFLSGQ